MKAGKVYRIKLDITISKIEFKNGNADTLSYFLGNGRFRDLAISPDGLKIYLACYKVGPALGKNKRCNKNGAPPANAGAILEYTYKK